MVKYLWFVPVVSFSVRSQWHRIFYFIFLQACFVKCMKRLHCLIVRVNAIRSSLVACGTDMNYGVIYAIDPPLYLVIFPLYSVGSSIYEVISFLYNSSLYVAL